jgi:hypothetical protein
MASFIARESVAHESAKHTLAKWLNCIACSRHTTYIEYPIIKECGYRLLDDLECYPVFEKSLSMLPGISCQNFENCTHYISTHTCVDPHLSLLPCVKQIEGSTNWCPPYSLCKYNGFYPVAVVDIVVPRKGLISEIWEIKRSNALSKEKLANLASALECNIPVYEIDCDWILKQDIHEDVFTLVDRAKKVATRYDLIDYM